MTRVTTDQLFAKAMADIRARLDKVERRTFSGTIGIKDHNSLTGLQGGSALERYHLTQAQHTALTTPAPTPAYSWGEIQALIDAAPDGGVVTIPPGTYTNQGTNYIYITGKALTLSGYGVTMVQSNGGVRALQISGTAGSVAVEGIKFVGPSTTTTVGSRAIEVVNGSVGSEFKGLTVRDCLIDTWGQYGIYIEFTQKFTFQGNIIQNIGYAGIMALCSQYGVIADNHIQNVIHTSGSNSYGIALSRYTASDTTTYPKSADVTVADNIIYNVPLWEGIDTHAANRVTVTGNGVYKTKFGINILGSVGPSGGDTDGYGSRDCVVSGNVVDSRVTDGTANPGIQFVGPTPTVGTCPEYTTGTCAGNTVVNHGLESSTLSGGILIKGTSGVAITGNQIRDPGYSGVMVYHTNQHFNVMGNTIIDPWSNSNTSAVGIYIRAQYNTGFLDGNSTRLGQLAGKTYKLTHGCYITSDPSIFIRMGSNNFDGYTTPCFQGTTADIADILYAKEVRFFGVGTANFNVAAPRMKDGLVCGTATTNASNGTTAVLVYSSALQADSLVLLTWGPTSGTTPLGQLCCFTRTSTYFSFKSTNTADTSRTVFWMIVNPS